eukprot:m.331497 g.331497  ORF g.331497 m.331497 type:complete len:269 (+) comp55622_c0_seq25:749-1555(+)
MHLADSTNRLLLKSGCSAQHLYDCNEEQHLTYQLQVDIEAILFLGPHIDRLKAHKPHEGPTLARERFLPAKFLTYRVGVPRSFTRPAGVVEGIGVDPATLVVNFVSGCFGVQFQATVRNTPPSLFCPLCGFLAHTLLSLLAHLRLSHDRIEATLQVDSQRTHINVHVREEIAHLSRSYSLPLPGHAKSSQKLFDPGTDFFFCRSPSERAHAYMPFTLTDFHRRSENLHAFPWSSNPSNITLVFQTDTSDWQQLQGILQLNNFGQKAEG